MPETYMPPLDPSRRLLMGPGPSDVSDRVLQAMSMPMLGHLDVEFVELMDRIQKLLRLLYQTDNRMTMPLSGTGSSGMEACLANLLEPGDKALVGIHGVFGTRMVDIATRCGATVKSVEAEWGSPLDEQQMIDAIESFKPKVVAFVHAETSTGVCMPVQRIAEAARAHNALVVLDTVTSLGGAPVHIDAWDVDAAYSGTQKCLSAPPGLSPVTFSDRAVEAVLARKTRVQSWYLDITMLAQYWGDERVYHHTAPISMNYALYEALRMVFEEGLQTRHARHRRHHEALCAGLNALGLELLPPEGHRLWMLNAIRVPEGVDEADLRTELLRDHGIEIGAGLGPLKGKIWRVGLMGASCHANNVLLLLTALENGLQRRGYDCEGAVSAALTYYRGAGQAVTS